MKYANKKYSESNIYHYTSVKGELLCRIGNNRRYHRVDYDMVDSIPQDGRICLYCEQDARYGGICETLRENLMYGTNANGDVYHIMVDVGITRQLTLCRRVTTDRVHTQLPEHSPICRNCQIAVNRFGSGSVETAIQVVRKLYDEKEMENNTSIAIHDWIVNQKHDTTDTRINQFLSWLLESSAHRTFSRYRGEV